MRGLRLFFMLLLAVIVKMFLSTIGIDTNSLSSDGTLVGMIELQVYQFLMGLILGAGILGVASGFHVKRHVLILWIVFVLAIPWIGRYVDPYVPATYDLAMHLLNQSLAWTGLTAGFLAAGGFYR